MAKWTAPDGSEISYELFGENSAAPVLVLLHGFLGSMKSQWDQFRDPLMRTHRVLMIDLRGHGRSTSTGFQLTPDEMVDDVIGVIESIGENRVHISGYSLGGYIALMTAGKRPNLIQTVHIHSTKFYWTDEFVGRLAPQFDPETLSKNAPTYTGQLAQEHGANRWRALARETQDLMSMLAAKGMTEGSLGRMTQPILVSVGDKDQVVTLPESARVASKLPKGGLFVLPDTTRPIATCDLIPMLPMMQYFHSNKNPKLDLV